MNEENSQKNDEKKEKIGIKLPWWISYPVLIILISLSSFFVYKAITKGKTIQTIAKINNSAIEIDNSIFKLSLNKEIVDVGEIIKPQI